MKKPVIAGSKAGESKPYTPYEAPNDLRSIATARVLLALGEGEFAGGITEKDIFLDGTPLMSANGSMNFEGVKWDFRPGTVNQSYIAGFPAVESEIAVGVELTSDTPWTKAINDSQVSAAVIRFRWPALQKMKDNGDVVGYSIQYRIDVSTDGGSFVTVATRSVTGKTNTLYERSTRVDLPAGNTRTIRVTRLTANQNNSRVSDAMFIGAITEVIDRKMRYPNTALLGIQFDASQFSNIPTVSVLAKMRKIRVPDTYDPETRTYSGIWSGAFKMAYSNNPAWVTYDLIVENRFSIGDKVGAQFVDKYELYKIAQYCDQQVPDGKGGTEHRYECNIYIATAAEAWQVLRDLSSIYRGMIYWMQSQMTVRADMPRDVDYVFTNANVIDGTFTYSGSDERVKYTRALVSYDNPDNNYESDVTSTYDNALQRRYGDNVVELSAFGCTRESEAQRRGKWAIYTNNNDRTVSFKTGMEGEIPSLGDIVAIADDLIAGSRIGGRIASVSADGKTITVDKEIAAESGDKLLINLPSGKAESRTVVSSTGKEIRVSTAYSESPAPFLQWTLEKSTLTHQLFQIVSARKADSESIEYEFSGVAYNPSKFDFVDTGARIEDRPVSQIPVGVMEAPEQVTIGQNVYVEQTMAVTVMTIGWSAVKNAVAYEVEWRKEYGEWVKLPRTGQLSIDVKGVYTGQYLARVRAVNSYDVASIPKSSNLTDIVGKTGEPPKLAIFRTASRPFAIFLDWSFGPDSEDALYTEIEYADNALGENAAFLGSYAYPTSDHLMMGLAAGVRFWFRARIKDRTGNLGQWTDWTLGESSVDADEILSYLGGKISEGELAPGLVEQIKDDVAEGIVDDIGGKIENDLIGHLTGDDENAPQDILWYAGDDESQTSFVGNTTITSAYNDDDYARSKQIFILGSRVDKNQALIARVDATSVSRDEALAQSITQLSANIDDNTAKILFEQTVRADADSALAQQISVLSAQVGEATAAIANEQIVRAEADSALAQQIQTISAQVDDAEAVIQQTSEALVELDGSINANWQVKTQVRADGKVVQAGVGLGASIGADGQVRSEFLVMADTIGFLNTVNGEIHAPFVFDTVNDTAFLNAAIIGDATIGFAKIKNDLKSNDYVPGVSGWIIDKNGDVEFNKGKFNGDVDIERLTGAVSAAVFESNVRLYSHKIPAIAAPNYGDPDLASEIDRLSISVPLTDYNQTGALSINATNVVITGADNPSLDLSYLSSSPVNSGLSGSVMTTLDIYIKESIGGLVVGTGHATLTYSGTYSFIDSGVTYRNAVYTLNGELKVKFNIRKKEGSEENLLLNAHLGFTPRGPSLSIPKSNISLNQAVIGLNINKVSSAGLRILENY
ncbi:host specificity protein J [Vibrio paracholerae]|uniref:host specificity protein J n=1 Tax=Vibrio paracholerae TaxID=650003 RepID=UPI00209447A2|nr:phage tail protein [Vibrio paracholerae]MCO7020917.1 phage tail protein [Vibrio paracholerae]